MLPSQRCDRVTLMYKFGSHLVKHLFPNVKYREPNDVDWVTNDLEEYNRNVERSVIGKEEFYWIPCTPNRDMTADEYYTLKVSHAIYDIHWSKTMSDIRFLQIQGCKIIPEFLQQLREFWNSCDKTHGVQRRTDFEVKPGKFFEDRVKRKINHDELHVKLVYPDLPAYKQIIETPESVKPIPELFERLTYLEQTKVVLEEAYVIATERFGTNPSSVNAYHIAQKILVTRLHPLWLADHIIQNWNDRYWVPTKLKDHFKRFSVLFEQEKL